MTRQTPDPRRAGKWNPDKLDFLFNKARMEKIVDASGSLARLFNSFTGGLAQALEEHDMDEYKHFQHEHLKIRST
jgi:hypothetical protein